MKTIKLFALVATVTSVATSGYQVAVNYTIYDDLGGNFSQDGQEIFDVSASPEQIQAVLKADVQKVQNQLNVQNMVGSEIQQ